MGESRVINVRSNRKIPSLRREFANGLVQAYVDQNLEARRQGSRDATEWLNQRLAELQSELNVRESALQQYRQQSDSVSLGRATEHRRPEVDTAQHDGDSSANGADGKQAVFEQLVAMQQSGTPLDTFSPILANPSFRGSRRNSRDSSESGGSLRNGSGIFILT